MEFQPRVPVPSSMSEETEAVGRSMWGGCSDRGRRGLRLRPLPLLSAAHTCFCSLQTAHSPAPAGTLMHPIFLV